MWLLCIVFGVLNWLLPPGKTFLRTGSACTRAVRAVVWVAHSSCWINHLKNMKKSTQPFIIVIENFILSDDHLEYKYIEVTLSLWNELNRVIFSWLSGHIAWETHSLRAQKNPRIYRDFSFVGEGSVVFSFCSIWKILDVGLINFRSKRPLLSFNLFCDRKNSARLTFKWIILTRRCISREPLHSFIYCFFLLFVACDYKWKGWLMVALTILENSRVPILIFDT